MASRENEKGLKHWFLNILILFSRDDKTRTCDLTPPRRVRYQLRYIPLLLKSECKGINFYWNLQTFWQVFSQNLLFKGKLLEGKWGLRRRKLLIITVLRRWCVGRAIQARHIIVGRGSPEGTVLLYHTKHDGLGREDGARRPLSYYDITFGYALLLPLFYCIIATASMVMAKFMWVCFAGL